MKIRSKKKKTKQQRKEKKKAKSKKQRSDQEPSAGRGRRPRAQGPAAQDAAQDALAAMLPARAHRRHRCLRAAVALLALHAACGSDGRSPLRLLEASGRFSLQPLVVTSAKTAVKKGYELMVSELAPQSRSGSYVRPGYAFEGVIPAEPGAREGPMRLYLGNPCPWCHRLSLVLAARRVPESTVGVTRLLDDPTLASRGGWAFAASRPDPIFSEKDLRGVYNRLSPGFVGRCTAPLAVDEKARAPISNESSRLIEILNAADVGAFRTAEGEALDVELRPRRLVAEIDAWNERLYGDLNNAVYRCGFATTQEAYEGAARAVMGALDEVEAVLGERRYLLGDRLTDADLRLFPTIIRYSGAYATIFRCGFRSLSALPNTANWMRDLYQSFARDTIDIDDAVSSYYKWLFPLNPSGIVPLSPDLGLDLPHGRGDAAAFYLRKSTVPAQEGAPVVEDTGGVL